MATTPKPPKLDRQIKESGDELIRTTHAKAGPLPDEPNFNEETARTLRDAREGSGLVRYDNWDDLFADLGL